MKSILKITTVMLVQALLANCAWAGVLLPPAGRRRGGCSGAALSPAVHIHINTFQDIFAASAKEGFLTGPGPDDEEEIGTAETTYLEFNMIFHQLNNVLQVVRGDIDILETEDELKDGEEAITAFVKDMVEGLADITSIFSAMDIIIEADILYLNEKVKQLNEKYAVLKELERVKTEDISVEISGLIARMISATEFVNRRIQAVREGINLEYFDLGELLKQEEDKGGISIEKGLGLEIFGYRDGMEFVIKNIIRNIIEHGRAISVYFEMSVKKDANNIVIEIKDTGRGFDLRELKNKAVELGFWDKEKAASAKEPETIELIFKKGFSRRYVKGKAYGLGMWLSRQVIEKYFKGKISAQNRPDRLGANFIITIPMPEEKLRKRVTDPRELLYQWAISPDEKQISQAWTHRSIAKAAGISKGAVTKHLPAIEKRLAEEKRPAIKKKLVDVAKALYRWARNRDKNQTDKEWTQKEIAEVIGVSESALSNHFAFLQERLKKEKLPPIKIKPAPEDKLYKWAIARTLRQINKLWNQRELSKRVGIAESFMPRYLEIVQERLQQENRPKILVGLADAYKQFYGWAVARDKQQIKKRWSRRELAEHAGISEASIGNYLDAVQKQLKEENRPEILLELSPQEKLYRFVVRRKGKPKQKTVWTLQEIAKGAGISEDSVKKHLPQLQQRLKNERKTLIRLFKVTTDPQKRIYEWAINRTKKQIDKEWTQGEIAAQAGIGRASVSDHIVAVQNRLREQAEPLIKFKLHINNPGGKLYLWALNRNLEQINKEWAIEELADLTGISERSIAKHLLEVNRHLENTAKAPIKTKLDEKLRKITAVEREINEMLDRLKREITQLKNKINGAHNAVNNTKETKEILQKFYRTTFNELMSALKFLNEINGVREFFPRFTAYAVTIKKIGAAIDIDREHVWTMSERLGKILEIIECHEKTMRKKLVRFELVDLLEDTVRVQREPAEVIALKAPAAGTEKLIEQAI
ncbi:MAG: hypothetical protein KKA52_09195 [Candidatus Omnitrophica bacterium]|nr:hypothetical protein [Candidatus Omnitrophota bacterium]